MPAHDVLGIGARCVARSKRRPVGVYAFVGLGKESVHLAAINVSLGGVPIVGPAAVHDVGVVVWRYDRTVAGVDKGNTGGQPIRAAVGAEVAVETAVLLHDEDEMINLVQSGWNKRRCRSRRWRGSR